MKAKFTSFRFFIWTFLGLTSPFFTTEIKAQTRLQDSLALVDFYNATDGQNWTNNSDWLIGPLDNWYGVNVQNERVHGLVLPNNNIQSLPSALSPLTELRVLNLSDNTISENIPLWINGSNFPNLEILSLNQCYFTGDLPISLSSISTLRELSINNPAFDDAPIPGWINSASYPNLQVLNLRQANRTGDLSTYGFLGSLSSLISLELAGNNFDPGPTPPWMTGANFPVLEQLLIGGANINNLSNDFVTDLFNNLTTLDISYNANPFVENPIIKISVYTSNFPSLTDIYARNIGLDTLPQLTTFPALNTFEARDNQLTFEDIAKNLGLTTFLYDPQERFGSLFQLAVCPDDIVVIPLDRRKALLPEYEIFRNGDTVTVGYFITNDTLVLNGPNKLANWTYRVFEKDLSFPDPSFRLNSNDHLIFPDNNCPLTPLQEDSVALVDFYFNAGGTGWTNNSSWLSGPLQSWEGVEIENDRVTKLNLSNVGIPFLPTSIMPLTRLKLFDISFNAPLSGDLFPGWINDSIFPSLKELYIQGCDFQGPIPGSISTLDSLEQLSMGRNFPEAGPIPAWINPTSFPFLRGLDLSYMNRTGSLEAQGLIADFPQLESLMIGGNDFDDTETPSWMYAGGFASTGLQIIDISALNLSKVADIFFSETFNLAALIVDFNPLTVNPVVQLGQNAANFPNFQSISIVNANIDSLPPIKSLMPGLNSISANNFLNLFWNTRNKLRFDDLARATQGGTLFINAQNQDTIGTKYTISVCPNESVKVLLDNGDAVDPDYVIRLDGNVVNSPNLIGDTLVIPAGGFGTWTYAVSELDPGFPYPSFILNGQPIVIFEAEYCIDESISDTLRSPSNPYEAIISKTDGSTWEEIDSVLINEYGAELKESCLCEGPRLYVLPDTLTDESGIYIGADAVRSRVSKTVAAQSLDFLDRNYSMKNPILPDTDNTVWDWDLAGAEIDENKVKVMFIDWGVERNHPYLKDYFTNTTTCPEFVNGTVSVSPDMIGNIDELGHGTAMMGIAVKTMEQRNDLLEVLSVKVGDNINPATLFGTICGLHLADKENVQVVNLSLGYSGEKSELLEEYIRKLQTKNTVISTSAGNDGINLDALPSTNQYWPAYFVSDPTIQNILTVGSYFEDNGGIKQKSSFSNYSNQFLSILAPGNNLWSSASSLVSDDLFASVSGTSGSAALVTGALASIYSVDPGATPTQAISTLFALYSDEVPSLSGFVPSGRILDVNLNVDCIVSTGDKAVNDSVFINSTFTTIPVLANDNPQGVPTITIFQQPNFGEATVDSNNNIIYEFTSTTPGITLDKLVYKLSDESDSCSYAMVVFGIGDIQDTIGTNYFFSVCAGDSVYVPLNPGNFSEPFFEVYYNGVLNSNVTFTNYDLVIFPNQFGEWNYLLYDNVGDSTFVVVRSIFIEEDLSCIDSTTSDTLRSQLNPYEAIITKSDDITWDELDSILTNVYDATLIESCLCDGPRLYLFPDTLIDESGVYVGADAVRSRTSTTVAAQTIEFFDKNYTMKNPVLEDTDNTVWDWDVIDLQLGEEKTKVMVIDWGVQKNHPYIEEYISTSPTICPEFDNGFAAVAPVNDLFADELGHGTAMTGILINTLKQRNDLLEVLVVKLGDDSTKATLFGTICGLHLAEKENVKAVNLSLGYNGEKSALLEDYIKKLQDKNILITTSAGNEGVNLDELPENNQYWPAYLSGDPSIQNLLTVGSYFEDSTGNKQKSSFSNYSSQYLTLMAPGNHLFSAASDLVSESLFGPVSGTSASAAMITGVVAGILTREPHATIAALKEMLFDEYTEEIEELETFAPGGRALKVSLNIDCILNGTSTAAKDSALMLTYYSNNTQINVLQNDIFTGEPSIQITSQPIYGTAEVLPNNNILYTTSVNNQNFVDQLVYKLTDENLNCSYALVKINSRSVCGVTDIISYTCNENEAGSQIVYIPKEGGCDSIVNYITALKEPSYDTLYLLTSIPGEVGTTIDSLQSILGCDSLVVTITALGQYNDNCQDALEIPVGSSCVFSTYSNAYATGQGTSIAPNPTCGFYSGGDVWFKFIVPATGAIRIERQNVLGVNAQFALYKGVCGSFVQLTCAQLDPDRTFVDPELAGDTLYLRVFNYGSASGGTFNLCVWEPEVPENNNCADALEIEVGTSCEFSNYSNAYSTGEALSVAPEPSCGFFRGSDVWFKFEVPESGAIRIETQNVSGVNAQFALYRGTCGSFTEVSCAQLDPDRTVIDTSLAGETAYLRVFNYGSEEGGFFNLCVWEPVVPDNNNCSDALEIEVGTSCEFSNYSNASATGEALSVAPDPSCGFYRGGDVWFKFEVPESGAIRVETQNISGVTAQFALFKGSCGNFTEVFCSQLDLDRTVVDTSLAGETVYLRVFNYGSEEGGSFNLCVWEPQVPDYDLCEEARELNLSSTCIPFLFSNANAQTPEPNTIPNPSCGFFKGGDVWAKVNMPYNGKLVIERQNIFGVNAQFAVYSGSCGNLTEVACAQLTNSLQVTDNSLAGQTLFIRAWNYDSEEGGLFTLCAYNPDCVTTYDTVYTSLCGFIPADTMVSNYQTLDGCDSVVVEIFTLLSGIQDTTLLYTCDPSEVGTVVDSLITPAGCDSVVTIITSFKTSFADTIYTTTCNPLQVGATYDTLTAANGCDSVVTTITTLVASYEITINLSTCNPAQAGEQTTTYTATTGCDSVVTIITELLPSKSNTVEATTCNPLQVGTTYDTLTASNGCDSIVTTITTLVASYEIIINLTTCNPAEEGEQTTTYTATTGCDSVVTIITELLPSKSKTVEATTCNPLQVGTTHDTLTAINGCDSVVTTNTTLVASYEITINLSTCDASQAGEQTTTYTAATGCDSVVTIITELLPSKSNSLEATTCDPTQVGTTYDTLTAANGCDSVVTTITNFVASYEITINLSTCDASQAGEQTTTYTAATGCDSLVTIITELLPKPNAGTDGVANICSGTPLSPGILFAALGNNPDPFGSLNTTNDTVFYYIVTNVEGCSDTSVITINYITPTTETVYLTTCNPLEEGTSTDTLTSTSGCDSVVITITSLKPSYADTVYATTCNPANEGVASATYSAANGCDSVVTTITTLVASYEITINLSTCDPAEEGGQTTTYTAATGCDSVVTIITELLPTKSNTVEATTCNPSQAGTTYDTLTAANGCDSLVTTITTLVASYEITINLSTCDPTQSGEQTTTYTAATGCDSVVTIITEFLPSKTNTIEATTCNPSQAGTTYDTLTAANGCDSVVTTITSLLTSYNITVNAQSCNPNEVGTKQIVLQATNGCDSIVTTITTLLVSYNITINVQSCNPDDVGTVQEVLQATNGCDSIINSVTTLKPTYEITLYEETTNPDEVGVESQIYTAANGCDSLITIVTTLVSDEQQYATLDYLTLFQTGIDQYWTLHTDGIARIEVRQDPVFSLTGKKKIVMDSPDKIVGTAHADLHINLQSGNNKDVHLFFWWKRYDGRYNDDVGVYYVDRNTNTTLFITKYKGSKDLIGLPFSINLTRWASKNGIELSDKAVIRFVYKTDRKVPNNIFQGGGGFALDMVYVHQNTNSINLKQEVLSIAENESQAQEIARRMNTNFDEEFLTSENLEVNVYPNPVVAGSRLYLELSTQSDKPVSLEIYSLEGRLIDRFTPDAGEVQNNVITLETLKVTQTGTYFIHVIEDGNRTVKKVQIVTAY